MEDGNTRHRRAVGAGVAPMAPGSVGGDRPGGGVVARTAPEPPHDGRADGSGPRPRDGRTGRLIAGVVIAGAGTTLLVSVLPFARLAYRDPAAHIALDTAGAVICTLAAYLLFERFRRTALLADLLLFAALAVFAAANLLLSVVPVLFGASDAISTWALFGSRLLGAVLLAESAFAGAHRLRAPRGKALRTIAGCGLAMALLVLLVEAFAAQLPEPIDPRLSPESSGRPRIVGHPLILTGQIIAMLLFAIAGAGFARKATRERDELLRWVAVGAVLAAFARFNYFLFPSLYTDFIYTGDLFRLVFYLALLVGGLREIDAYQRGLAEGAVLEERRRIARDLHDGLAQDLAFITSQTRAFGRGGQPTARLERVASAAERALDDSRAAIAALTRPLDEPLDEALARSAREIAERSGIRVRLDLQPAVEAPPAVREAFARIVREATSNAARHGRAREVEVSLSAEDGLRLAISDDGDGFDPAAPPRREGGGFGLTSMRERAEALGGEFRVTSSPGGGTRVEVVLP